MENKLDPSSTVDMIKILQERFRDRIPRKLVTYDEVCQMQGSQKVIDYMVGTLEAEERRKGAQ